MQQKVPTITLERLGQYLRVSPTCEELRQTLQTTFHLPAANASGGCDIRGIPQPLFAQQFDQEDSVLDSFAGLRPVVNNALAAAGYKVVNKYREHKPLPEPKLDQIAALGPCDVPMLRCIQKNERALIRLNPAAVDPAWLIAQVALAFPKVTLAVATTRISEARHLRKGLLKSIPGVAVVTSKDRAAEEEIGRVVVATYTGLGHTAIEIQKRKIVIALNAVEASNQEGLYCLGFAAKARMYGLLDCGSDVAPHQMDRLRFLFGFEEVVVPAHGQQEMLVEVVRCHNAGGIRLPADIGPTDLKRRGIWHNAVRNRCIARFAQLLKDEDRGQLQESFPVVANALKGFAAPSILILVENIEHAMALIHRLPGWPLFAGREPWMKGMDGDALEKVQDPRHLPRRSYLPGPDYLWLRSLGCGHSGRRGHGIASPGTKPGRANYLSDKQSPLPGDC